MSEDTARRNLRAIRRQLTLCIDNLAEAVRDKDAILIKSLLSLLDNCVERTRTLDQDLAEILEDSTDADADEKAQKECLKAFEYMDKASKCRTEALNSLTPTVKSSSSSSQIRLEKLSLPDFDGNILSFYSFWQSFDGRVHSNSSLNAIDKFDYLISKCTGIAADSLKAIPRTADGYDLAVRTLHRRFGSPAPIVNQRLTKLVEIKPLSDECSTSKLRSVLDEMDVQIRSLLSHGLDPTGGADWIGPILLARLPHRLRLRWEETMHASWGTSGVLSSSTSFTFGCSLSDFLDFFARMVEIEETSHNIVSKNLNTTVGKDVSFQKRSLKKTSRPISSSSFATSSKSSQPNRCLICNSSDHSAAWLCQRFKDMPVHERRRTCQRLFLCFNCISRGHLVAQCSRASRCRKCQRSHHTLLHQESSVTSAVPSENDSSVHEKTPVAKETASTPANASTSADASIQANATTICGSTSVANQQVLLPSCRATAQGFDEKKQVVRVLFDSCSTFSFIRRSVADELGLSPKRWIKLEVNTFGEGLIHKSCPIYSVELVSHYTSFSVTVDLIGTDSLVHPIQGRQIELDSYPHLKSLFLSEDYSSSSHLVVDVLIGADLYHDFVSGRCKRGARNEPIAIETSLGWTIHGPFSSNKGKAESQSGVSLLCKASVSEESLTSGESLKLLWSLEALDISPVKDGEWIQPKHKEGRIFTNLPWKSEERPVGNRPIVDFRQQKSTSRLNESQLRQYDE